MSKFGLKKRMILKASVPFMVMALLAGCGIGQTNGSIEEVGPEVEQSSATKVYSYSERVETEECTPYTEYMSLSLLGGNEAIFESKLDYGDYTSTQVYKGVYEMSSDHVSFTYVSQDEEPWTFARTFYLEGDEVVEVSDGDTDFSEIVGEYTNNDEMYGLLTLTVEKSGKVQLTGDGFSLEGYVIFLNDKWDMMASNDEFNFDWYIDFDGDKFTYVDYYSDTTDYAPYAGVFTASGDFGPIDFTLGEDGSASCEVTIDGVKYSFDGYYYPDTAAQEVSEIHVYGDVYSLQLQIVNLGGGEYNYSGDLIKSLSAG